VRYFEKQHQDVKVNISYGASGTFFAQLQNRAPFDLYFSADLEYPRRLAAAKLADGDVFHYGTGRLVLWVGKNSSLDLNKLGAKALLEPAARKVAIANPRHAPYGRAAVEAMKSLGVYNQTEARLVLGENVAQAAQFVQSGAADIGIIAFSAALHPQMREGTYWEIPPELFPPLAQGGMITRWATDAEAARTFRDYVLGKSGRAVLKRHGFIVPGNPD
jgi:molybdate transport system substrate-binding protein